jgi:hypothetical protein
MKLARQLTCMISQRRKCIIRRAREDHNARQTTLASSERSMMCPGTNLGLISGRSTSSRCRRPNGPIHHIYTQLSFCHHLLSTLYEAKTWVNFDESRSNTLAVAADFPSVLLHYLLPHSFQLVFIFPAVLLKSFIYATHNSCSWNVKGTWSIIINLG